MSIVTITKKRLWFDVKTDHVRMYRQFFRGGSFVDFGGEKEERKEGGKFVCLALGGIVAASTDATWR
jgi:hypothetical protein